MSIPVDDWEPVIGPSTAMRPGLGEPVAEFEDEQPDAMTAVVARTTAIDATRIRLRL
jgi:hypothetical protein